MKPNTMNFQKPGEQEQKKEDAKSKPSEPKTTLEPANGGPANGVESEENQVKASVQKVMDSINEDNFAGHIGKARQLKTGGNVEACLDVLDAMIRKGKTLFGELDARLAEAYFRLGDVLLQALEDQNDLFGDLGKKGAQANSDREEDIRVSWENLEIARVILEKYLEAEGLEMAQVRNKSLLLADVFKRLGECENLKENFSKAREELKKGIRLLEKVENVETSRILGEHCYLMSRTLSYEAKPGHAKEAKVFIDRAIRILENNRAGEQAEGARELETILQMMRRRSEDLREELEATDPGNPEAIKEAIAKTKFKTSTSFPKSQLKSGKVRKLGTFGKGSSGGVKKVQTESARGGN